MNNLLFGSWLELLELLLCVIGEERGEAGFCVLLVPFFEEGSKGGHGFATCIYIDIDD